jgi:hypothetical protein
MHLVDMAKWKPAALWTARVLSGGKAESGPWLLLLLLLLLAAVSRQMGARICSIY